MRKIPQRGKAIAKRIPIRANSASLIGALEGKIKVKGDILSTGIRWPARGSRGPLSPARAARSSPARGR